MAGGGAPGRFSGLTTRGRCLLAGGGATAACAIVLDERDLLRIGVFVALLPLLALLLAARTRRVVRVARELKPPRLPVGGEATVELKLRGTTLLGALRLVDTVPDAAGPQPQAPPRFTVHRLSRRGGARLRYPLRPVLRGVHRVGPLAGIMTDPLGLAEFQRELDGSERLLALPRVVPLRGEPAALGTGEGTPGASLAHQGQGTSDVLVRPYRFGDEIRRVHWRSTARHDELMVRLEERPWRGGMTVLLDRRDGAHRGRGSDSSLEFAVTMTASICAHLIRRGEPVAIVTEEGTPLTGGPATTTSVEPLLDALAALRPSARTDLAGPELALGNDVLAVLGMVGPGQIEALLARRTAPGHAVLLDTSTWDPAGADSRAGATAAMLRGAGWRVAVATARSTPERVWDDLVTGAAPDAMRGGS
ncbi:DUF58 domain-containing protein [Pseudonocardia sp. TRM90224]|uniref:DUF58 domain-containing protein n=1 Tax=Pseudonocardia sp. TRM90224 TaxID=2812678 RepID=UPI001E4A5EB8|nr:DUF58 domain-containing protein [Pseudonocardia sp. TRM90224]